MKQWLTLALILGFLTVVLILKPSNTNIFKTTYEDQYVKAPKKSQKPTAGGDMQILPKETKAFYVPVYSHIYGRSGRPIKLSITLSVRNRDPKTDLVVNLVDFYDTTGKLIRHYLKEPKVLKPMETKEFFINDQDSEGGSGANFIVGIQEGARTLAPYIEALMVGSSGNHGYSFTSQGQGL